MRLARLDSVHTLNKDRILATVTLRWRTGRFLPVVSIKLDSAVVTMRGPSVQEQPFTYLLVNQDGMGVGVSSYLRERHSYGIHIYSWRLRECLPSCRGNLFTFVPRYDDSRTEFLLVLHRRFRQRIVANSSSCK